MGSLVLLNMEILTQHFDCNEIRPTGHSRQRLPRSEKTTLSQLIANSFPTLKSVMRELTRAYFALIIATGIVSIASHRMGFEAISTCAVLA
jgi:hypothetical protein